MAKELDTVDADVLSLAEALEFTPFLDRFVDTYSLGTRQKLRVLLRCSAIRTSSSSTKSSTVWIREARCSSNMPCVSDSRAQRSGVLLATHSLDIVEHHADAAALMLGVQMILAAGSLRSSKR